MMRLHTDLPRSDRGVLWLAVGLATLGVSVAGVIGYLFHRAQLADERTERQRIAICSILANIPGDVPKPIADARTVFARPGHIGDCQPIRHPQVTAAPTPRPSPAPTQTVIVITPSSSSAHHSHAPRQQPSHTPAPSPSHSPTPRPSPSPSCDLLHPLRCV